MRPVHPITGQVLLRCKLPSLDGIVGAWDALDFYASRVDWYREWISADIRAFLAGRRRSSSGRP